MSDAADAGRGYLLANQQPEAVRRFEALAALFDDVSLRHLTRLGLAAGSRVWEVGAGGVGLPTRLAAVVGLGGRVLATDLDPRWLRDLPAPVEVRRHELGVDPVPDERFDLVHARLLLVHLPQRQQALEDLVQALRPGGWLVVEEADPGLQPLVCPDEAGEAERLANRLKAAFRTLMAERGVDLAFGRRLPRLLRAVGLQEVAADAYFPLTAPACAVLEEATVQQIRTGLLEAHLADAQQIERHLAAVRSGRLDLAVSPLVSCWGRKPEAGTGTPGSRGGRGWGDAHP